MSSTIQRKGYFCSVFMLFVPQYDISEIYRKFDWIYTDIFWLSTSALTYLTTVDMLNSVFG